jgi:ribonucleoside-diphosphate reductase alpha chain
LLNYKEPFYWLNDISTNFLYAGETPYLPKDTDAKKHFRLFAEKVAKLKNKPELANIIYDYIGRGYYLIPTPGITNFLTEKESPVSCFGSYVEDSVFGLMYTDAEIGMMSKLGGGTSAYLGDIRAKGSPITGGGHADGVMRYALRLQDTTGYINQKSRRGKCAAYLSFNHPEIHDWLTIMDKESPIQELPFGVCISDEDIAKIKSGDKAARNTWAKVIKKRFQRGFPYIFFTDNVNNNKPEVYSDNKIYASNLCTEICLPSSEDESFTCVILALNLVHYDDFPKDVVDIAFYILDAFVDDFISKNEDNVLMARAVDFAKNHRAVGLGASGWHSYLQLNNIAIESMQAKHANNKIFKWLRTASLEASEKLAVEYGEAPITKGTGRRHSTLNAIAPNTSSSEIFGQWSQSIEPIYSNYMLKALAKGKRMHKNPILQSLLHSIGQDTEAVWDDIAKHNGSVQHLEFLSQHEKDVFKTFIEISPMELLIQNAQRQKYIDQGISFNTMVPAGTPAKDVSTLYLKAHELGLKSLYYQLNQNSAQQFTRKNILECSSCAG